MAQDVLITSGNHLQPLSADHSTQHRMLYTREDRHRHEPMLVKGETFLDSGNGY